jgi:acetyl esterase
MKIPDLISLLTCSMADPTSRLVSASPVDKIAQALGGEPPQADPDMQAVLDALESLGGKPIEELSPEEARRQPTPTDAVLKLLRELGKPTDPEPVGRVQEITIPGGPMGDIPAQVFSPKGLGPFPVIVYFHGGGFVIADTKVYEASVRALVNQTGAIVVSVDYHHAPEHPYPTQTKEAYTAYLWTLNHAQEINGDPQRVAVAGESAGGNLAAVVSLMARDQGQQMPVHALLVYPLVNNNMLNVSYRLNANAKPLNAAMMKWFFKYYSTLPESFDAYALPAKADTLKGFPPATIITAEIDPLQEEGRDFAERLHKEGVPVTHRDYAGVTHEFFGMSAVLAKAKDAQALAAGELKKAFGLPASIH